MSANAQFSEGEQALILELTGLSVKVHQLSAVTLALVNKLDKKLPPIARDACNFSVSALRSSLGQRDRLRVVLLMVCAAKGEQINAVASARHLNERLDRLKECIDVDFKWFAPASQVFDAEEVRDALGYKSRDGFWKLRKRCRVEGGTRGKGLATTFNGEEIRKLLRERLAKMPWYEGRLIAARIAGRRKKSEVEAAFDAIAPKRPANPFQRKPRRRLVR